MFESDEGVWRKAAKKVERKKGRWEDMLPLMGRSRGAGLEKSKRSAMILRVHGEDMHGGLRRGVRPCCDISLLSQLA